MGAGLPGCLLRVGSEGEICLGPIWSLVQSIPQTPYLALTRTNPGPPGFPLLPRNADRFSSPLKQLIVWPGHSEGSWACPDKTLPTNGQVQDPAFLALSMKNLQRLSIIMTSRSAGVVAVSLCGGDIPTPTPTSIYVAVFALTILQGVRGGTRDRGNPHSEPILRSCNFAFVKVSCGYGN